MPLSRHLYELDEVKSALQICLWNKSTRALFWCWELVVSGETHEARCLLHSYWLIRGGGKDPDILTMEMSPELYTRVVAAVAVTQGHCSAQQLIERTTKMHCRPFRTPPPATASALSRRIERSTKFVEALDPLEFESITKEDAIQFWISLDSACRQGYCVDAVWLLQAGGNCLSIDALWCALRVMCRGGIQCCKIIEMLASLSVTTTHPILFLTHAVLYLCIRCANRKNGYSTPSSLVNNKRSWDMWSSIEGRRIARIYAIPTEALTKMSTRGNIPRKYTNIAELRNPLLLLHEGCQFWQRVVCDDDVTGFTIDDDGLSVILNDELYLSFIDTYFPDDFPDEWSALDQGKSHGRGCQETVAPCVEMDIKIREDPVGVDYWMDAIRVC